MHEVVAIDFKDWRVYYEAYGLRSYWNKNIVLMQSTGLYDKHGVEIFEGDILNYGDYLNSHEVVFKEGRFWGHAIGSNENIGIGLFNALDDLKVIGNIYSNPELLEVAR